MVFNPTYNWGGTTLQLSCCQVHVVRLLMSPNSSFIALAVGNRLETFATDDAGLSWHEIHHPNAIRLSFMFHPNRPVCRLTLWCLEICDSICRVLMIFDL